MSDATTTQTADPAATAVTTTTTSTATGSAVPEYFAKDWIKSDYSLDHKALDRLPDHLKGLRGTLERQKNFDGILMALDHAQSVAGKKALAPLAADAPDPVKAERKALLDTVNGVPATPKDYGIARPQDFDEKAWDPKAADAFAAWAHKNSISPKALNEFIGTYGGIVKEQLGAQQAYEQQFFADEAKAIQSLLTRENIPMDRAQAMVDKAAIALGHDPKDPSTQQWLKSSRTFTTLMRHAQSIGEDKFVTGTGTGGEGADPAKAAEDIQRNPANPLYAQYWNKDNKFSRSQQQAAQEKVHEYLRLDAEKRSGQGRRR